MQFVPSLASTKLGESEQPTSAWSLTGENTISSPPQLNIKARHSLEKGILPWTREQLCSMDSHYQQNIQTIYKNAVISVLKAWK